MVMSGVPLSIFENQGFFTLNGKNCSKVGSVTFKRINP